jgi:O-acetyl-ADP-ribose deacetylase (regulator of RNase III)
MCSTTNTGEKIYEQRLSERVKIEVVKGKLWLQKSDAIVNPCEDVMLRHNHGVSKDLVHYAGSQIYDITNEYVLRQR